MRERPLTRESADRLTAVLTEAGDLVEAGSTPDAAIAKAASVHGLPVLHVPLAVRGYNNGRAARQLAESRDPWVRASSYPTASVDGVVTALTGQPAEKTSVDSTDYDRPPDRPAPTPPDVTALAALFGVPATKEAAVRHDHSTVISKKARSRPPEGGVWHDEALGRAIDVETKLASVLAGASPGEYAAARAVTQARHPEASAFLFAALDRRFKKATVAPDPSFPADHPALALVAEFDRLRRTPKGRPPAVKKASPIISRQAKEAGFRDTWLPRIAPTLTPGSTDPGIVSNAAQKVHGFIGRVNETRGALADQGRMSSLNLRYQPPGAGGLPTEFSGLATQEVMNSLLQDPRMRGADPAKVVQAYQSLAGLAPNVMLHPTVASEFVHRTLQTGPLSYHDLGQLTKIEKDFVTTRRHSRPDGEDE